MAKEQEYAWILQQRFALDAAGKQIRNPQSEDKELGKIFQQSMLTLESEFETLGLSTKSLQYLFASIVAKVNEDHKEAGVDELWKQQFSKFKTADFLLDLIMFITASQEITAMVVSAAIKRKTKGIPALREQNTAEQLQHLIDHLELWKANEIGDEDTVEDQAKHTVCRALLAYFTMKSAEIAV